MKLKPIAFVGTLIFCCCINLNLYAQYDVKITGNSCKGAILTANSNGPIIKLEWKRDGKTIALDSGSSREGVTVAGGNGEGSKANQLDDPNGVFVDRHGNIWVADTKNARIQKFLPGCDKGITIGADLPNAPTFPTNLFVCYDGSVYVADYFASRVKRLAPNGNKWIDVAGQRDEMKLTRGVWVDKYGNVFATDCGNSRVLKYASNSCVGVVVAGGNGYGSNLNQLAQPVSVVVDNNGNSYITDKGNNRVVKWAPGAKAGVVVAGNGLANVVTAGGVTRPLYASLGGGGGLIANNNSTFLYISDNGDRVQKWLEGTDISTIVAGGNGRGDDSTQLNRPFANCLFEHYLFVADHDNARIQRFDLNENILNTQFTTTQPGNYSVTATFSNGKIVTSNTIFVREICDEFANSSLNTSATASEETTFDALAYPNPAKNSVVINFSAKQNGKYIFELAEISGKVLLHKEFNALKGANNVTLDLSQFTKGIYFINITDAEMRKQSVKLNKE